MAHVCSIVCPFTGASRGAPNRQMELKEWRHAYYLANRDKLRESKKKYYAENLEATKERQRRYYLTTRSEAFNQYGRNCASCSETNEGFLTLDHIHDDGAEYRRTFGSNLYLWAAKNGYPPILQTLCYNCQWIKELRRRSNGAFAHQEPEISRTFWNFGPAKGFCCRCKAKLTPQTCRLSIMANEYGLCRYCQSREDLERAKEAKRIVLEHFGGKCECCSETRLEVLTIGHPNRDGSKDRRISGRGTSFYRKLIKNDFQNSFTLRIECINCNFGSFRNIGNCPHVTLIASHKTNLPLN
jgi:hypothetical protein